jgi:aldose 1-epimerase
MGAYITGEIEPEGWDVTEDLCGEFVETYTLTSGKNLMVRCCSFGATLLSVKSRANSAVKFEEITLNRTNLDELFDHRKNPKYGATCGRVAGRISNGYFALKGVPGGWFSDNRTFYLEKNNGTNCLHGGSNGFHRRNWDSLIVRDVKLSEFVEL